MGEMLIKSKQFTESSKLSVVLKTVQTNHISEHLHAYKRLI